MASSSSSSSPTIPVKYEFQGSLRRSTIDVPPRLNQLRKKLAKSFPEFAHLFEATDQILRLVYTDDEGDEITIATNDELVAAYRQAQETGKVLRFSVPALTAKDAVSRVVSTAHGAVTTTCGGAGQQTGAKALLKQTAKQSKEALRQVARATKQAAMAAMKDVKQAAKEAKKAVKEAKQAAKQAAKHAATSGLAPKQTTAVVRHWGVRCDATGQNPIVGPRYHKRNANYDLCQAAFDRLTLEQQALYQRLDQRAQVIDFVQPNQSQQQQHQAAAAFKGPAVHVGVTCDVSGQSPILGTRYWKVGANYDLCEAEYNKLQTEAERAKFIAIEHPCTAVPLGQLASTAGASTAGVPQQVLAVVGHGIEHFRRHVAQMHEHHRLHANHTNHVAYAKAHANHVAHANDVARGQLLKTMCDLTQRPHHKGITCDACQMPIVGARYWKVGTNFDLCEADFSKLPAAARQAESFTRIDDPQGQAARCARQCVRHLAARHQVPRAGRGSSRSTAVANDYTREAAMKFVADVTVADGAVVAPGSRLRKTWRVATERGWDAGTVLRCVDSAGPYVGLAEAMPAVPAGSQVDLSIALTAPAVPGTAVRSHWALFNTEGTRFGDQIWIDFVTADDPAAPAAAVDAVAGASADGASKEGDTGDKDGDHAPGNQLLKQILAGINLVPHDKQGKLSDTLYTALQSDDFSHVLAALAGLNVIIEE